MPGTPAADRAWRQPRAPSEPVSGARADTTPPDARAGDANADGGC